jgi:hypothetical protein
MRKRITLLIAALMLALSMSFGGVAFAGGHHGCAKHSQGHKASHGKCRHKDKHGGGGGGGGDDGED